MEDRWWAFNAKTTSEASDSAIRFIKDMSFANSKPFYITKAYATSETDKEKTCQQLATTTTSSLSFTATPIPHLPSSIRPAASILSL